MITKDQVISVVLEVCPFYKEHTEKHLNSFEEDLLYVFVPDLVNSAIELEKNNKQKEILSIFEVVEKLLIEGDKDVKNIIKIGVLENFRIIFGKNFAKFVKYLKPNSLRFWKTIPKKSTDNIAYPKSTF